MATDMDILKRCSCILATSKDREGGSKRRDKNVSQENVEGNVTQENEERNVAQDNETIYD